MLERIHSSDWSATSGAVCPLSVAANWTEQFQQHVGKKRLKWHMYHGEGRDLSKRELRKFDVVIST